ncbi:MAG: hypothetical protein ACE361_18665 [Aureliella sp.]
MKLKKHWFCMLLAMVITCGQAPSSSIADDGDADAKFVVQLDLRAFRKTEIGSTLLNSIEAMAAQEIGSEGDDVLAKVEEAVGFDPLEEIQSIVIRGNDFESPEDNLDIMIQLGETSGNLEGLALAAPGYESEEHGKYTIHRMSEGDMEAFATIHTDSKGDKCVVATTKRSRLMDLLESMGGRSTGKRLASGVFAHVELLKFPKEVYEQDQAANVVRMIKRLYVDVGQKGDELQVDLVLAAQKEKQAEQIKQLADGAKAFVGLFKDEIGDDEDAQMVLSLLERLTVERDEKQVKVHFAVPESMVKDLLHEEMDLSF